MTRHNSCGFCGEIEGTQIGNVDYWDIKTSNIIRCPKCGLSQIDPMLTAEETDKGCLAYYVEESLRMKPDDQARNMLRQFRRGVVFGRTLKKKGIQPNEILELGPGSGYFVKGILFVFPESKVSAIDVNKEVLDGVAKDHGYSVIQSEIETHLSELDGKFDLIIARDILEHVIDPASVIKNVHQYLKKGGVFNFVTPNGRVDVWKHYLTLKYGKSPSELLINHVNYFDGTGLRDFLENNGFNKIEYYNYRLKTSRRGRGWAMKEKLSAKSSEKKSASLYAENKIKELKEINIDKSRILDQWYINPKAKFITYLICWYHHANLITVDPKNNFGHEIYGLFQKK